MSKSTMDSITAQQLKNKFAQQRNNSFNHFLHITDDDSALLQKHHALLNQDSERFAQAFYDYLFHFPATAKVLQQYQAQGGQIEDLVRKQLGHLRGFLRGDSSSTNAQALTKIGQAHYRHSIEPSWIMGAYLLYLDHLHRVIVESDTLPEDERASLEDAIQKFLFRDMGMMMEGYWDTALEQIQAEKDKVALLQTQISALLANIPQVLWSVDVRSNTPLYISPSTQNICTLEMEMPIPCLAWTHPEDRPLVQSAWTEALRGNRVEVESRIQEPGQPSRWFRRIFNPFTDDNGHVVRIDGLMDETTKWKEVVTRLNTLATTDSLTGLPNRSLFYDRLSQALSSARRLGNLHAVLMLLDLDHFKEINDTFGHPAGDEILRQVAVRLAPCLRDEDTLARLGGDEFAILLPQAADGMQAAQAVSNYITQAMLRPFEYDGQELYLGVAIGIAIFPEHGDEIDTLMSRADLAMYSSKHKGIGPGVFHPEITHHVATQFQMASDLRRALERGEFLLHYQPKIHVAEGRLYGVEALLRWQHPDQGLILPDQFLPIAERSGLIHPITDWIIQHVSAQSREWQTMGYGINIAINISPSSFQNPHLLQRLQEMLENGASSQDGGRFEVEITENTLMSDIGHGSHVLLQLRALGITVAIDDFGTGYCSLGYLRRLPIHALKLDKSFILNMADDMTDAAIVRSTIDLAHNLGYAVVAEGVENQVTLDLLREMRCDSAQGYFIGLPMEALEISRSFGAH